MNNGSHQNRLRDRDVLRNALDAASQRRDYLGKLPRSRRLVTNPRQVTLSLLNVALSKLPGATLRIGARTFWGDRMTVVLPEAVSGEILRFGYIEENLVAAFLAHVRAGHTIFDVGAHFGFFSLLASQLVGPGGQVHAFEPVPSTCAVLRQNIAPGNGVAVNCAVWKEAGEIDIRDFGLGLSAFNSVRQPRLSAGAGRAAHAKTLRVPAITLDDYARDRDLAPDFVKIDAESAEFEVLEGMQRLLHEARPVVSIEVGDFDIVGAASSAALVRHMEQSGYRPVEYADGVFKDHQTLESYTYGNLLFLPE